MMVAIEEWEWRGWGRGRWWVVTAEGWSWRGWERKRRVLVVAVEGFGERMLVDTTIHLVVKPFSTSRFVSN